MSRSQRKTPVFGITTAKSEKQDKQIWHSRLRSRVRTSLASIPPEQLDGYIAPFSNDVSSVWSMSKDGKRYFHPAKQIAMATRISGEGKDVDRAAITEDQVAQKVGGEMRPLENQSSKPDVSL